MRSRFPLLLGLLLASCGGGGAPSGGGTGGGGTVVTPTPTPSATASPAPTPSPSSWTEPATGSDFFASIATLYTVQPDIAGCVAGQLKPEVGRHALDVLNAIRAEHNLPAVQYAAADEPGAMQSSLMQAANGSLSHNPPASWNCYTSLGATVAGQSNLYGGTGNGLRYVSNDDLIIGWLTDVNNLVADNVGHRRWLLYPFLNTVAYGRVAGRYQSSNRADAATIKVINSTTARPATLPPIVAYPFEDYPLRYWAPGALLSFSVIADTGNPFGGNASVNFSNATVSVRPRAAPRSRSRTSAGTMTATACPTICNGRRRASRATSPTT